MKVIKDMDVWRNIRRQLQDSVGFVATMGALHDGHASLLRRSVETDTITVLSIYVNPTQFNDPKDLANYPDTLDEDLALAERYGVDYVILPRYEDIYADGFRYQVCESEFSKELCGGNRPGHFTGVLTVVMKLLNLVQPTHAYFGEKDYQQYTLIRDMAEAFFMPVEIVPCPTVRECDGLAMSSRNKLLSVPARSLAGKFNKALSSSASDELVRRQLGDLGFAVDYVVSKDGRRFGAVVVECEGRSVRLIDNVQLQTEMRKQESQTA
ncbi:MAG: pantoate--beta-alanine ligase [Pseudomonadota bacterium]